MSNLSDVRRQRDIGMRYCSVTGRFYSLKNKSAIHTESTLEQDFCYVLEFDKTVIEYLEQPVKIKYSYQGKDRSYTPDFFIAGRENDRPYMRIYEVKPLKFLKLHKDTFDVKFTAATEWCKNKGWEFHVINESIRGQVLENYKFLYQFKRYECFVGHSLEVMNVLKALGGKISLRDLFKHYDKIYQKDSEDYIAATWYLVAELDVQIDLEEKITMQSKVWI